MQRFLPIYTLQQLETVAYAPRHALRHGSPCAFKAYALIFFPSIDYTTYAFQSIAEHQCVINDAITQAQIVPNTTPRHRYAIPLCSVYF